jgi:hypothetical protein
MLLTITCCWHLDYKQQVRQLHTNANYFRRRLLDMGLHVLGDWDSPVMPIMIYQPGRLGWGGADPGII